MDNLKNIDQMSKKADMYINHEKGSQSKLGGFLTISVILILIANFGYFFN